MTNTLAQIGSDGALETYEDTFADVTPEMVVRAEQLENEILDHKRRVDVGYLKMARDLSAFNREKLYLARGFRSFREWASSPELASVTWRTAYNLMRIADEVIPLLEANGLSQEMPPISTVYDLLPLLNDEDGQNKFLEGMRRVKGLTNRDAKIAIKELRGKFTENSERTPTMFRAKVTADTESGKRFNLVANDGVDIYNVGTGLFIKSKDWARFALLLGDHNIDYPE